MQAITQEDKKLTQVSFFTLQAAKVNDTGSSARDSIAAILLPAVSLWNHNN